MADKNQTSKQEAPKQEAPKFRGRRPWSTPTLTLMRAGGAELNVGAADDGVDKS